MAVKLRTKVWLAIAATTAATAVVVLATGAVGPMLSTGMLAGDQESCVNCPLAGTCAGCGADAAAVSVDPSACVGCRRCVAVAPEAYRMNPETHKAEAIAGASVAALEAGARACPVHAIH